MLFPMNSGIGQLTGQDRLERAQHLADRHEDNRNLFAMQEAMNAAPADVVNSAAVIRIRNNGELVTVQQGTNGWTCIVHDVGRGEFIDLLRGGPICLDKRAVEWRQAWLSRTEPKLNEVGLAYLLDGGDCPSPKDPFATKPPTGAQWLHMGTPHIMIVGVAFDHGVYSTEPSNGKPWIMWAETPYAHLMVPVNRQPKSK